MALFDRSHTSSYSSSIITMAMFCIISGIKLHIGRKSRCFHTPLYITSPVEMRLRILFFAVFLTTELDGQALTHCENNAEEFNAASR